MSRGSAGPSGRTGRAELRLPMASRNAAVLLFDFDNTITRGDLLDAIIERFSRGRSWIEWEKAWREGALSAPECLKLQMGNLAASRAEILAFAADAAIDPA